MTAGDGGDAPLRILFASGEPYLPDVVGGAERSVDELVRELLARGHRVEVLAGVARGAPRRRHRLWRALTARRRLARRDARTGYATHRAIPRRVVEAFEERMAATRPDVVVGWNRACEDLARAAHAHGVPSILWVHDATFAWSHGRLPQATRLAAVSEFLAKRVRERIGRPADLLRPCLRLDDVRAPSRVGRTVAFVNPRPAKGLEVALAVARRLPRRRFVFVGSRGLPRPERAELALRTRALPHVDVVPFARDMRTVYARTALLLVPSQGEDAGPRVVLEAQANGIPVLASDVGGIGEVAGGAAVLLPPHAPVERWAAEVERILDDPGVAEDLADRGRANAERPDLRPDAMVAAFLRLARQASAAAASPRGQ